MVCDTLQENYLYLKTVGILFSSLVIDLCFGTSGLWPVVLNIVEHSGKAVALALTPGMPEIEAVNIRPQGNLLGRILFQPTEYGREGDMWHNLSTPGGAVSHPLYITSFFKCHIVTRQNAEIIVVV